MSGSLQLQPRKILRFVGLSAGAIVVTLLGVRLLYSSVLDPESTSYRTFVEMGFSRETQPSKLIAEEPPVPKRVLEGPRLERIEGEGVLRVCYFKNSLPFAFVNAENVLVGFDVEMAHDLARDMNTPVEFVRVARANLEGHLNGGTCDIAMSGMAITPKRTRKLDFTNPYLVTNLAFVVKDHMRQEFSSWERLRGQEDLHLITPPTEHFISIVQRRLPNARITPVTELRGYFRGDLEADGLLFSAEAGSAWTLVYPSFTVAVPQPGQVKIPLAYVLPKGQGEFKTFVDTWLSLEIGEGAVDALFEHWILGRAAEGAKPRWSILNDVLRADDESAESEKDATDSSDADMQTGDG